MSVPLIPIERGFFLQQMETITVTDQNSENKCILGVHPSWHIWSPISRPYIQEESWEKGQKDCQSKGPGCSLLESVSGHDRKAVPMKSQQYSCPQNTPIMTAAVDLPTWIKIVSQGSKPGWKAVGNKGMWEKGEFICSRDELFDGLFNLKRPVLNTCAYKEY